MHEQSRGIKEQVADLRIKLTQKLSYVRSYKLQEALQALASEQDPAMLAFLTLLDQFQDNSSIQLELLHQLNELFEVLAWTGITEGEFKALKEAIFYDSNYRSYPGNPLI